MIRETTDLQPDLFAASDNLYFDHNATAPLCRSVLLAAPELLQAWGNPSSIHQQGRKPKRLLREARASIAKFIDCHPLELVFTSGGSESNSLALKSEFLRAKKMGLERPRFLASAVEHPATIKSLRQLQEWGAEVEFLPVDRQGQLDLISYEKALSRPVHLVSCMAANNETGVLFPIQEMCQMAQARGAKFHCDAVQALGKMDFSCHDWGVDYASFAGHKFYSARGVGLLYSKQGNVIEPLVSGGGQERARRGGTENLFAIASLGIVCDFYDQRLAYIERVRGLRDLLEEKLLASVAGVEILGRRVPRVCNTSSLLIEGIDGETLMMNLDMAGVAVSTGAACSSGNPEPSPVLLAMGLSREQAQSSLRVSLGWGSKEEEVLRFVELLVAAVERLRALRG